MSEHPSGWRGGALLIFNALFWAGAILGGAYFFGDRPWADQIMIWLLVPYIVINGLLLAMQRGPSRRCE